MAERIYLNLASECNALALEFRKVFPSKEGLYLPFNDTPVLTPDEKYYIIKRGVASEIAFDNIHNTECNVLTRVGVPGRMQITRNQFTPGGPMARTSVCVATQHRFENCVSVDQIKDLKFFPHHDHDVIMLVTDILLLLTHSRLSWVNADSVYTVTSDTIFAMVKGLLLCKIYGIDSSKYMNIGLPEAADETKSLNLQLTQFGYSLLMADMYFDQYCRYITGVILPALKRINFTDILDWMIYEISSNGYVFEITPVEDYTTHVARTERSELRQVVGANDLDELKTFIQRKEDELFDKINAERRHLKLSILSKHDLL